MPFAGEESGPGLINGEITAVEVESFAVFEFASAMAGIIKGADQREPKHGGGEDRAG